MKKVEVEISTDYGFAHYGGWITDETEKTIEISDKLADYLRPQLDEGELDMGTVDELLEDLKESNPTLARELGCLYDELDGLCHNMVIEHGLEADRDYYDDDNLAEYYEKDIKEGLFVPNCTDIKTFYENHKDDYEDFEEDYFEIEEDFENAKREEYMYWVDHLDSLEDRCERCFGDCRPGDCGYDWDFTILSISE